MRRRFCAAAARPRGQPAVARPEAPPKSSAPGPRRTTFAQRGLPPAAATAGPASGRAEWRREASEPLGTPAPPAAAPSSRLPPLASSAKAPEHLVDFQNATRWAQFFDTASLRDLNEAAAVAEAWRAARRWPRARVDAAPLTLAFRLRGLSDLRRARLRARGQRQLRPGVSRFGPAPAALEATAATLVLSAAPPALRVEHIARFVAAQVEAVTTARAEEAESLERRRAEKQRERGAGERPAVPKLPQLPTLPGVRAFKALRDIQRAETAAEEAEDYPAPHRARGAEEARRARDLDHEAAAAPLKDFVIGNRDIAATPFQVPWDLFAACDVAWNGRLNRPALFGGDFRHARRAGYAAQCLAIIFLLLSGTYLAMAATTEMQFKFTTALRYGQMIPATELAMVAGLACGIGMRGDVINVTRRMGSQGRFAAATLAVAVAAVAAGGTGNYRAGAGLTAWGNAGAAALLALQVRRRLLPLWLATHFGPALALNAATGAVLYARAPEMVARSVRQLLVEEIPSGSFSLSYLLKRLFEGQSRGGFTDPDAPEVAVEAAERPAGRLLGTKALEKAA